MTVNYDKLPILADSLEMYGKGETTGSNKANRQLSQDHLKIERSLTGSEEELLFDPQTSGGLLLSMPPEEAESTVLAMHEKGIRDAVIIGEVEQGPAAIRVS